MDVKIRQFSLYVIVFWSVRDSAHNLKKIKDKETYLKSQPTLYMELYNVSIAWRVESSLLLILIRIQTHNTYFTNRNDWLNIIQLKSVLIKFI